MQVINGKVLFSRTVKPADYEGKKAECELSYIVGEGEDPVSVSQVVMNHAKRVVLEAVDLASPAPKPAAPPVVPVEASPQIGKPEAAPQVKDPFGGSAPIPAAQPTASVPNGHAAHPGSTDPFGGSSTAPATAAGGVGSTVPMDAPTPDITDAGLRKAIENKVANAGAMRDVMTVKVKELIAQYSGSPVKPIYSCTPPEQRLAFINDLSALTVAAP